MEGCCDKHELFIVKRMEKSDELAVIVLFIKEQRASLLKAIEENFPHI